MARMTMNDANGSTIFQWIHIGFTAPLLLPHKSKAQNPESIGAEGRSRTDTPVKADDFESTASAISPLRHEVKDILH